VTGAASRVGLLAHQLDGELTGVGRYMAALIAELCRGGHGIEAVPLVVGPLGALGDEEPVRRRVPADDAVARALAATQRASRVMGHRAAFLTAGSAAAALAARRLRLDVVHDLTGLAPFLVPTGRCRRVITVHDLISHRPDGGNDRVDDLLQHRWLPPVARAAAGIVAVSATTADDVRRFLGVPAARVHVAHHAVDPRFRPVDAAESAAVLRRHGLSSPFVLFVGSASPRKNLATLVQACRRLWADGGAVPLVVAGPARPDEIPGAAQDIAAGRIAWVGYVPEAELPALYTAATVLAFPSSYEGFGLPALEAMSCGTPVLAGRGGALPEVVGDAGVLVEPTDAAAMADALGALLRDAPLRARLRERGRQRARGFTWARTAQQTVAAYAVAG
jgi:glycosyltransferase involved in cell wall biosynthesis